MRFKDENLELRLKDFLKFISQYKNDELWMEITAEILYFRKYVHMDEQKIFLSVINRNPKFSECLFDDAYDEPAKKGIIGQ